MSVQQFEPTIKCKIGGEHATINFYEKNDAFNYCKSTSHKSQIQHMVRGRLDHQGVAAKEHKSDHL